MDTAQGNRIWQDSYHEPLRLRPSLPRKSSVLDTPSLPSTPLDGAMLKPGYPGALSLHHYRKHLSQDDGFIALNRNERQILRRKNAAHNLNQSQMSLTPPLCSFSVSSAASSPPPLSPSYSPSAVSQRSEYAPGRLDDYLFPFPSKFSGINTPEPMIRPTPLQSPHQLLDTFRARLAKFPEPQEEPFIPRHAKARSDSMLLELRKPAATVEHQGASFEILNPHDSLKFARIVSYIEDVDNSSLRESFTSTDARSGTLILEHDGPVDKSFDHYIPDEEEQKVRDELVGDSPHQPMPSISERLERTESDVFQAQNWSSTAQSRPVTGHSCESELGEPGSSVFVSYDDSGWMGTMEDILQTKYNDEMQRRRSLRRSFSGRKKKGRITSFKGFRRLRGLARRLFR
ncbi:oxidoreductase, short-chain dehydrogenase/reductase family [Aspergillus clavatus NRRL 1]|uniref:Uncharacterized protein n=1 Tax=Aspergillus clavatus (strain ATCC 1007 / CBS 513.65 / DSM 816 / NCTC 3887 / NRRL 1 / QM 1276 / 107) TaxID=344612 RepID=A1CUG0_ASPCL|nr:uncharacterized protein ACLA_086460 [Aspergillus clavatus NRRL 1]EAW06947.1 conserved hypothetical protein [Aspergillus clavatus NRRL 1]